MHVETIGEVLGHVGSIPTASTIFRSFYPWRRCGTKIVQLRTNRVRAFTIFAPRLATNKNNWKMKFEFYDHWT